MLHMYFAHTNQTLLRLNGPDYEPCQYNGTWDSIEIATNKVKSELTNLILELLKNEVELPYIVEIYKFHKKKYRWISNTFGSIYFYIVIIFPFSTMTLLEEIKIWTNTTIKRIWKLPRGRNLNLLNYRYNKWLHI